MLKTGISIRSLSSIRKFSLQSLFNGYLRQDTSKSNILPCNSRLLSASLVRKLTALQRRDVSNHDLCSTPHSRGLVLGVYANEEDKMDIGILTDNAAKYNEVRNRKNDPQSM